MLDYARIYAVHHDENKMRLALWQGLKFTLRNFLLTGSLAFLMFAAGGLALWLYNPVANSLSAPNGLVVFLLFIWQQAYMLVRMAIRLLLYASETHLFENLVPQTAATEETQQREDFGPEGLSLATE